MNNLQVYTRPVGDFPHLAGLKLRFLHALSVFFKFFTVTEGVEKTRHLFVHLLTTTGIFRKIFSERKSWFFRVTERQNQALYFSGSWWTKTRVTFDETHAHPLNMNKPFQIVEIYW